MNEPLQPFQMPAPPAAARLVRPNRCENCKYASPSQQGQGLLDCHFGPPNVNGVFMGMGKDPVSGQAGPQMMAHTAFPIVRPDDFCAQWFAKVVQ